MKPTLHFTLENIISLQKALQKALSVRNAIILDDFKEA
jgi:hypothetical protein